MNHTKQDTKRVCLKSGAKYEPKPCQIPQFISRGFPEQGKQSQSMRTKKTLHSDASASASQAVEVSPPGRPSTQALPSSPPRKAKKSRKQKAVKRSLNMDTESESSSEDEDEASVMPLKLDASAPAFKPGNEALQLDPSASAFKPENEALQLDPCAPPFKPIIDHHSDDEDEDDIKVLALMHELDPSVPPFKLARSESDIFGLPPLDMPRIFLQEINKDTEAMDEDMPTQHDAPPELLRSIGKRPAPSITSSLKKFAKVPRLMDGGSSAHNVAHALVRTKSVCFVERPGSTDTLMWGGGNGGAPRPFVTPAVPDDESIPESPDVAPTWGGAARTPPFPGLPDAPPTPTKPATPPMPDAPPAPDVNAISFITSPESTEPPLNPASMNGTIRNLFRTADPGLGLAEFDNFDD